MGKKDTVNKEERISNLTLYGQTVSFGFTRMWLYVKGTLFFTVILILFILIDHLIGPKGNDIISWIGFALAIFAFFFIAILPSEPMRASHTAIMTEAILHNNIPQPCVKKGMELALQSFPCMSFLLLFTEVFKSLRDTITIKDVSKRNDLRPKLKSMIMFLLSSMVPYVGPCATSWAFSHHDKPTKEGLLEGAHLFFINLKGEIAFLFINAFLLVVASIAAFIGFVNLAMEFVSTNPFFIELGKELLKENDYAQMGVGPAETAMIYLVGIFLVYVVWVFVRPLCTIPTLKVFYRNMSDDVKKELFTDHVEERKAE